MNTRIDELKNELRRLSTDGMNAAKAGDLQLSIDLGRKAVPLIRELQKLTDESWTTRALDSFEDLIEDAKRLGLG